MQHQATCDAPFYQIFLLFPLQVLCVWVWFFCVMSSLICIQTCECELSIHNRPECEQRNRTSHSGCSVLECRHETLTCTVNTFGAWHPQSAMGLKSGRRPYRELDKDSLQRNHSRSIPWSQVRCECVSVYVHACLFSGFDGTIISREAAGRMKRDEQHSHIRTLIPQWSSVAGMKIHPALQVCGRET